VARNAFSVARAANEVKRPEYDPCINLGIENSQDPPDPWVESNSLGAGGAVYGVSAIEGRFALRSDERAPYWLADERLLGIADSASDSPHYTLVHRQAYLRYIYHS